MGSYSAPQHRHHVHRPTRPGLQQCHLDGLVLGSSASPPRPSADAPRASTMPSRRARPRLLSIATTSIGRRAPGFNNAISKGSSFIAIGLGIVIIVSAVMGVEIIALH